MSGNVLNDLVLAVSEACANAVLHSGSDKIIVEWAPDRTAVRVVITDEGVFRRRVPMPEYDDRPGHGIPLMVALVDEVDIREGTATRPGTVVRLVKARE